MNLTTMTHVAVDGVMQGTAVRRTRTALELVDSRVDSKGVTIQRYRPTGARTTRPPPATKETTMPELLVDFITSLDGYAAAEGGRAGGGWKDPSTSRGWESSPKRTTRS